MLRKAQQLAINLREGMRSYESADRYLQVSCNCRILVDILVTSSVFNLVQSYLAFLTYLTLKFLNS